MKKKSMDNLRKFQDKLTELFCQVYYEEMHPLSNNLTAEEVNNRKEKAIDEYMGKSFNPLKVVYPILHHKVDKAVAIFTQELEFLWRDKL